MDGQFLSLLTSTGPHIFILGPLFCSKHGSFIIDGQGIAVTQLFLFHPLSYSVDIILVYYTTIS